MPTLPDAYLRDILTQAEQDLAAAELRRAQQARIVAGPLNSPETRAAAELLLREIDRTITSIWANRHLIEVILA
ncbi:hypothetical protein ASG32_00065 [Methylobacterium sp. Leaf361]|uniref:hypothetical protein n=1 Tax=Methylobacterium sp. Leaf361 TaxID=1736352 RepID=UPI0006F26E1F|nr:hypothetical protein [Methylobacterium sp. Leaf361]KQS85939.1 hypothetical protein ASG32_00065 [Methylobacterium sp. Leaf361]